MNAKQELLSYISSLTPEQAKEALATAYAWLAERQEAMRHPQEADFS